MGRQGHGLCVGADTLMLHQAPHRTVGSERDGRGKGKNNDRLWITTTDKTGISA